LEHDVKIQLLVEQVAVLNDTASFEKLFHIYYGKLHRFAYAIIRDQQFAEEVVSDVFVNLWRNRSKLLEIENLNNYLYTATKNLAIRSCTKLNRMQQFTPGDIVLEADETAPNPEDILLGNELLRRYEAAVSGLPTKCRTIYRLAKQDGLKYKEIATILSISVKTIDAQLAIAVKKITQAMKFSYTDN